MKTVQDRAAATLRTLADAVEKAPLPIQAIYRCEFSKLRVINKATLKAELDAIAGRNRTAIYTVKLDSRHNCSAAWAAMNAARTTKAEGRAYSRVHPFEESEYLYVGSSADVSKRLVEHFGFGQKATYSLHLACWASDLPGAIEVGLMLFDDIDREVLCALEDHLAGELRPLFGRRGSL